MKVTAPDKLHLQTSSDTELEFHWENPAGRLPGHCLEWEVRHHHVGTDGKISLVWLIRYESSNKTHCVSLYVLSKNPVERFCTSSVNFYLNVLENVLLTHAALVKLC